MELVIQGKKVINSAKILVYSKAAAARILGVAKESIASFQVWWKVALVWVKGRRPIFLSLRAFRENFADWRREQSKFLQVSGLIEKENCIPFFKVVNPKKKSSYRVEVGQDKLQCSCEDFRNQTKFIGKGCCKHCYAALSVLGFDSLYDWIEENRWASG